LISYYDIYQLTSRFSRPYYDPNKHMSEPEKSFLQSHFELIANHAQQIKQDLLLLEEKGLCQSDERLKTQTTAVIEMSAQMQKEDLSSILRVMNCRALLIQHAIRGLLPKVICKEQADHIASIGLIFLDLNLQRDDFFRLLSEVSLVQPSDREAVCKLVYQMAQSCNQTGLVAHYIRAVAALSLVVLEHLLEINLGAIFRKSDTQDRIITFIKFLKQSPEESICSLRACDLEYLYQYRQTEQQLAILDALTTLPKDLKELFVELAFKLEEKSSSEDEKLDLALKLYTELDPQLNVQGQLLKDLYLYEMSGQELSSFIKLYQPLSQDLKELFCKKMIILQSQEEMDTCYPILLFLKVFVNLQKADCLTPFLNWPQALLKSKNLLNQLLYLSPLKAHSLHFISEFLQSEAFNPNGAIKVLYIVNQIPSTVYDRFLELAVYFLSDDTRSSEFFARLHFIAKLLTRRFPKEALKALDSNFLKLFEGLRGEGAIHLFQTLYLFCFEDYPQVINRLKPVFLSQPKWQIWQLEPIFNADAQLRAFLIKGLADFLESSVTVQDCIERAETIGELNASLHLLPDWDPLIIQARLYQLIRPLMPTEELYSLRKKVEAFSRFAHSLPIHLPIDKIFSCFQDENIFDSFERIDVLQEIIQIPQSPILEESLQSLIRMAIRVYKRCPPMRKIENIRVLKQSLGSLDHKSYLTMLETIEYFPSSVLPDVLAIYHQLLQLTYPEPLSVPQTMRYLFYDYPHIQEATFSFLETQLLEISDRQWAEDWVYFFSQHFQSFIDQRALRLSDVMLMLKVIFEDATIQNPYHVFNQHQSLSSVRESLEKIEIKNSAGPSYVYNPKGMQACLELRKNLQQQSIQAPLTSFHLQTILKTIRRSIDPLPIDEQKLVCNQIQCMTGSSYERLCDNFDDPFLYYLLDDLAEDQALYRLQFSALLKGILSACSDKKENVLSEQQILFFLSSASITDCPVGKKEGISLAYQYFLKSQDALSQAALAVEAGIAAYIYDWVCDFFIQQLSSFETWAPLIDNQRAVAQFAHYSVYLKNHLAPLLGLDQPIVFDPYTQIINKSFLEKSRKELLQQLFDKIDLSMLIAHIQNSFLRMPNAGFLYEPINAALKSSHLPLSAIWQINEKEDLMGVADTFSLTPEGALALLKWQEVLQSK
jgi:hypothetical protein